ncbi:hypothetical protein QUF74_04950 [Candidatus Halobeggiatoa sp. HSG11]|nr:hypothetical protein [Candidatus Halobeggiatoa sp. HSG11]
MKNKEQLIKDLGIDVNFVKPCSSNCCHYGEGCALGYPIYAEFNGFGSFGRIYENDVDDIKMMYSKDFYEYWRSKNPNINKKYIPCFHIGCSCERCNKLDDIQFMSRWMRDNH